MLLAHARIMQVADFLRFRVSIEWGAKVSRSKSESTIAGWQVRPIARQKGKVKSIWSFVTD